MVSRARGTAWVLLSTYNGARFLASQLDSILAQEGCDLQVLVRDDGSSDGTVALVRDYAARDKRVRLIVDSNLGVTRSFLTLLSEVSPGADGYLFCDQDDIWYPDKVSVALQALADAEQDEPLLYCSRLRYVDEQGVALGLSPEPVHVGLANALVENIAIGCTAALNAAARDVIVAAPPRAAIMHDWWCYLVVAAIGRVIYDRVPRLDYRQHSANTVGAAATWSGAWTRRIRGRLRRPSGTLRRSEQAADLLRLHASRIAPGPRALIEDFVLGRDSFVRRCKLVAAAAVRRGGMLDQAVLSAQLILNDY